jgi:mannosyltransferase OCH1-like enzyme
MGVFSHEHHEIYDVRRVCRRLGSEVMESEGQIIPPIFHRIWLGGPMPAMYVEYGQSWQALHPSWEMRLWTESNLPPLVNQGLFEASDLLAQKADIVRYEILSRYGGVYLDCDFECLKCIEPLLDGLEAFAAKESEDLVGNSILGATAGHRFFEHIVDSLGASVSEFGLANVIESTGPDFLTRQLAAAASLWDEKCVVLPAEYFYPYHWSQWFRQYENFDRAYGAHHWSGWNGWNKRSRPLANRIYRLMFVRSVLFRRLTRRYLYRRAGLEYPEPPSTTAASGGE